MTGDFGTSDDWFVGTRLLGFVFAAEPFLDETGPQGPVRRMRPAMSEQDRAHRVFLGGDKKPVPVSGMNVGFRRRQEPCAHHHAVRPET